MRIDRPTKESPTLFFAGSSRILDTTEQPTEQPKEPATTKTPKPKDPT